MEYHFLLKRMIENHDWLLRLGHLVDKIERSHLITSRKTDGYLLAMIKFEISGRIYSFGKLVSAARSLRASHNIKAFLMRYYSYY